MSESEVKMFSREKKKREISSDQIKKKRRKRFIFLLMRKAIYTRQCDHYNLTVMSVTVTSNRHKCKYNKSINTI